MKLEWCNAICAVTYLLTPVMEFVIEVHLKKATLNWRVCVEHNPCLFNRRVMGGGGCNGRYFHYSLEWNLFDCIFYWLPLPIIDLGGM